MGADAFIAVYGVKLTIVSDEEEEIEARTDDLVVRAQGHNLQSWFGRLTDGSPPHLYVGHLFGDFGVEGACYESVSTSELERIVETTRRRLALAGFTEKPALHFQLEAQF